MTTSCTTVIFRGCRLRITAVARRHRGDGAQSASRPVVPRATLGAGTGTRISCNWRRMITRRRVSSACSPTTDVTKLFHFARFDLAMLYRYLGVMAGTGLLHQDRLTAGACTFSDRHGLRDLCKDLLNIDLSKQQRKLGLGAPSLSDEQLRYAALGRAPSPCAAVPPRRDPRPRGPRGAGSRPASNFCRIAFCLISRAGWSKTSSRTSRGHRGGGGSFRCRFTAVRLRRHGRPWPLPQS